MHCESQLSHSGVPILHDMTGTTLLYFSCIRLPSVQLRSKELQCHVALFPQSGLCLNSALQVRYKILKWLKSATEPCYVMSYTLSAFTVH